MRLIKLASHQQVELIKRFIYLYFFHFVFGSHDDVGGGGGSWAQEFGELLQCPCLPYLFCIFHVRIFILFIMIICATHFRFTAQDDASTFAEGSLSQIRQNLTQDWHPLHCWAHLKNTWIQFASHLLHHNTTTDPNLTRDGTVRFPISLESCSIEREKLLYCCCFHFVRL